MSAGTAECQNGHVVLVEDLIAETSPFGGDRYKCPLCGIDSVRVHP